MRGSSRKVGEGANERAQGRMRKQERLDSKQEVKDLIDVMGTPEGRRLLWRIVHYTGSGISSVAAQDGILDPIGTIYNEGRRDVGLMIREWIKDDCPAAGMQMYNEMLSLEAAERAEDEREQENEGNEDGTDS